MSSTWFITGASRGIGRELTEQVLARGDSVAATLRHPEQLDDLTAVHGDRLWVPPDFALCTYHNPGRTFVAKLDS